jgi:hypothetical protein
MLPPQRSDTAAAYLTHWAFGQQARFEAGAHFFDRPLDAALRARF